MKVKNKSKTMFTLNLARGEDYGGHDAYLPHRSTFAQVVKDKDGNEVGVKEHQLAQPASISWLPDEVKDVPHAVERLEDFRKAKAARILVVVEDKAAPEPKAEEAEKHDDAYLS